MQLSGLAPWKSHHMGTSTLTSRRLPPAPLVVVKSAGSLTSPVASPGQSHSLLKLDLRACFVRSSLFWGRVAHTEYGCLDQRFLILGFGWNNKRLASLILCFCHVAPKTSCHPLHTVHTMSAWLLVLSHPTCYQVSSMAGQPCFVLLTALSSAPSTMLGT